MCPIADYPVVLGEAIVHVDFAFCESDRKEKLERLVVVDSVWKKRREKSPESKGGYLKLRWHLSCLDP
jgi:hypothetical protein